jgi:outer membrane receptor protein involved in Fe transport
LSADARVRGGWSVRGAYAYQSEPRVTPDDPSVPLFVNRPPRHTASLSAERRAERWFASASVSYSDRAFWADVLDPRFWGYSESYELVSGAFGYSVRPSTQLVLSGTNLFDQEIQQHVFGDVIGRKVSFELRQRF